MKQWTGSGLSYRISSGFPTLLIPCNTWESPRSSLRSRRFFWDETVLVKWRFGCVEEGVLWFHAVGSFGVLEGDGIVAGWRWREGMHSDRGECSSCTLWFCGRVVIVTSRYRSSCGRCYCLLAYDILLATYRRGLSTMLQGSAKVYRIGKTLMTESLARLQESTVNAKIRNEERYVDHPSPRCTAADPTLSLPSHREEITQRS